MLTQLLGIAAEQQQPVSLVINGAVADTGLAASSSSSSSCCYYCSCSSPSSSSSSSSFSSCGSFSTYSSCSSGASASGSRTDTMAVLGHAPAVAKLAAFAPGDKVEAINSADGRW